MTGKVAIRRLATGVPGLDAILGGGLPEYSFNLISGPPGSGKTTLAHQIMCALANPDRTAILFTALGEPPLKMLRYPRWQAGVVQRGPDTGKETRAVELDGGDHLVLELTESGLMRDTANTMAVLQTLKKLGVQVAIDDFGTGYSSLSYLRRFPIDTLKIDQSFVQDIRAGQGDALLVSTIIAMGRSLNLQVVAEGIETTEQLVYLQSQQCVEGQGFYFSRPVTAGSFARLLAANQGRPTGLPA